MHGTEHVSAATVVTWLPAGLWCVYVAVAFRERSAGREWSHWRTLSFSVGIGLLAVGTSRGFAAAAHHDFSGHMLQHVLLGMLAPIAIVLSAPFTLVLRTIPRTAARGVARILRRQPFHAMGHPAFALTVDVGALWLLYLTPLYALSLQNPTFQNALHVHFVAAGCLFAWTLIGIDPSPQRAAFATRVAVLGVAIAAHSTLAKVMYAYGWPQGTPYSVADIRQGAQLMYYGGDGAELLLLVILFARWFREQQRRHDAGAPTRRHAHVSPSTRPRATIPIDSPLNRW